MKDFVVENELPKDSFDMALSKLLLCCRGVVRGFSVNFPNGQSVTEISLKTLLSCSFDCSLSHSLLRTWELCSPVLGSTIGPLATDYFGKRKRQFERVL